MSRQVKRYTVEFKQEAIKLALKSPSIAKTAKELGVPAASLHTWVNKLKDGKGKRTTDSDSGGGGAGSIDVAAVLEENRRLHKENVVFKEEKEILKKAVADSSDGCNK